MLYRLVKILMTIALRFFYRRIYVTGLESIPPKGPVIILANHPSALMDAAIIGLLVRRPVHFFTRGDVFVSKPVNYLFSKLRMIPIHNHEGGRKTMGQNEESFLKAEKILSAGGVILFFPEGNSKVDHKLVPLRKGVFRMALQAAVKNDFKDNISFITAGINYDHPTDSRKDVMVHFGTPFFLNEYKEDYCQNPAGTLLKMTKRGYEVLEKKVLHINDPKQYALAEKCLANYNDQYSFYINSWQQATIKKFEGAKEICNRINAMSEKELEQLQIEATNYKRVFSSSTPSFTKQLIKVITFPFFILAYLFNAPPILLAKRIADKKVHRPDYYSWVFVVCSMVLYIIWLIILFLGILLFLPLLQDLIK